MNARSFEPFRIVRRTGETVFAITVRPREGRAAELRLPNRILAHFLDHLARSTGVQIVPNSLAWPGSWGFDHVLCEDLGQLAGRAYRELHDRLAAARGVPGRGSARGCMDDADVEIVLGIEDRPAVAWSIVGGADIDGFVDAWFDGDTPAGHATGTNLRQFIDGFARGAGMTLRVDVRAAGNLHHLWEAVFRTLGDAVARALGLDASMRRPGDTSGLAGAPRYEIHPAAAADDE